MKSHIFRAIPCLWDLMERFCLAAVLRDLRGELFDPAKLHLITSLFDEFNLDHLAVELLVKVKNMRFHVFF